MAKMISICLLSVNHWLNALVLSLPFAFTTLWDSGSWIDETAACEALGLDNSEQMINASCGLKC